MSGDRSNPAPGGGPRSTAARIIDASIQLFNQNGFQKVPMLRIASQVGMSSGNLAYHFKTKRDILLAILPLIEDRMQQALVVDAGSSTPESAARYQIGIFRTLWRFRFFFNALTYLLSDDAELREWYLAFQNRIVGVLRDVTDALIAHKQMRAVLAPNSTELVCKNMWMLWLSWLRFEQVNNPEIDMVETAAIYDGALHHFSLMQPYYGREFAQQLLGELRRILNVPPEGLP